MQKRVRFRLAPSSLAGVLGVIAIPNEKNHSIVTVISIILIAWLYHLGFLVSLNFSYDHEVSLSESPEEGMDAMEPYLRQAIDDVIGNYSVETWMKYANLIEGKTSHNYELIVKLYKEKYGSVEKCNESTPVYIKQYNLAKPNETFWRWESLCHFQKTKGKAIVEYSFVENKWKLLSWGIK